MGKSKYNNLLVQVMSVHDRDGIDASIDYLDNCIENNPNFLEAYIIRGTLFLESDGDLGKALKDFEKAIMIDPDEQESYLQRGIIYAKAGDVSKAFSDFSKTIELDANNAAAYSNRANMYLKMKEPQKAISDCTKSIELSHDNFETYFNRGLAYANMGEFTKAIKDYDKVIELIPENTEAYYKRGRLYSQLDNENEVIHYSPSNNKQKAIRDYEKFLELDSTNANAALVRSELDILKNGKVSGANKGISTLNTEIKKHLIIMIIGAVIGGFLGFKIGQGIETSSIVFAFVLAFLGIGLGPFLEAVKKYFSSVPSSVRLFIKNEIAESDHIQGFFVGLFKGLLGCVIYGTFKLIWESIKSPFVAIFRLVELYGE